MGHQKRPLQRSFKGETYDHGRAWLGFPRRVSLVTYLFIRINCWWSSLLLDYDEELREQAINVVRNLADNGADAVFEGLGTERLAVCMESALISPNDNIVAQVRPLLPATPSIKLSVGVTGDR